MQDKTRILAANDAFYAAFRSGNLDAMDRMWSKREQVAVFHPNWPGIDGRDAVMESWSELMLENAPPQIFPLNPTVIRNGRMALVICEEEIGTARAIATNVFVDESGVWRMVHHQASQLPQRTRRGQGKTHRRTRS